MNRIRVLVVHPAVVYRDAVREGLSGIEDIELTAVVPNGELALKRLRSNPPDLVVISADLRDVPPAAFTRRALALHPELGVLVLAPPGDSSAATLLSALDAGAMEGIVQPEYQDSTELGDAIASRVVPALRRASTAIFADKARSLSSVVRVGLKESSSFKRPAPVATATADPRTSSRFRAVLIGLSTGGPELLEELLPAWPVSFPVPVVIVLHMPKLFTASLAATLDQRSALRVKEASLGDELEPGTVYLAPGGMHLSLVRETRRRVMIQLLTTPPVNGHRPSADVLFESGAQVFGRNAVGLILTGMGEDGVQGLRALKEAGAHVIAQDEESSVIWGMPGSAVRENLADEVLPAGSLAARVGALVGAS